MRFKKIKKSDSLYIAGNLIASGHWLFCIDWIQSLGTPRATMGIRRAITRMQLSIVTMRLTGNEYRPRHDIEQVFKGLTSNLSNYTRIDLNSVTEKFDFLDSKVLAKGVVARVINNNGIKIGVDSEYFTAFLFDPKCEVLAKGEFDPILVKKNNSVVAIVMPMRLTEGNKI